MGRSIYTQRQLEEKKALRMMTAAQKRATAERMEALQEAREAQQAEAMRDALENPNVALAEAFEVAAGKAQQTLDQFAITFVKDPRYAMSWSHNHGVFEAAVMVAFCNAYAADLRRAKPDKVGEKPMVCRVAEELRHHAMRMCTAEASSTSPTSNLDTDAERIVACKLAAMDTFSTTLRVEPFFCTAEAFAKRVEAYRAGNLDAALSRHDPD